VNTSSNIVASASSVISWTFGSGRVNRENFRLLIATNESLWERVLVLARRFLTPPASFFFLFLVRKIEELLLLNDSGLIIIMGATFLERKLEPIFRSMFPNELEATSPAW
jgi:hypothetical protein